MVSNGGGWRRHPFRFIEAFCAVVFMFSQLSKESNLWKYQPKVPKSNKFGVDPVFWSLTCHRLELGSWRAQVEIRRPIRKSTRQLAEKAVYEQRNLEIVLINESNKTSLNKNYVHSFSFPW